MKTFTALLFTALFAFQAQAQFTFFRSDWKKVVGDGSVYYDIPNPGSLPVPATGPNQIWDYSTMAVQPGQTLTVPFDAGTLPALPDVNIVNDIQLSSPLPVVPFFPAKEYAVLDNTGWRERGTALNPITLPLAGITGGANDALNFTGNLSTYEQIKRQFPLQFGDTWNSSFVRADNFLVTIAAFGLNNVPGSFNQDITDDYQVAGWGTLRLPNVGGGPVVEHEALLLKRTSTTTRTYLLGGAPAPSAFLAPFGLSQGQMTTFTTYIFLVKGLEDRALEIGYYPAGPSAILLQNQTVIAAVPTMSEWGLFLFALIVLTLGLVFIAQPQYRMAMAGTGTVVPVGKFNLSALPFDKPVFLQALQYAVGIGLAGFVFIYVGWGKIEAADVLCMPLAMLLVAYQLHVVMLYKNE